MHYNWDHAVAAAKAEIREERLNFSAMLALLFVLVISGLLVVLTSALAPFSLWTVPLLQAAESTGLLTRDTTITGNEFADLAISLPLALAAGWLTLRVSFALLDLWTSFTAGLKTCFFGAAAGAVGVVEVGGFVALNWFVNDLVHRDAGLIEGLVGPLGHQIAVGAFAALGCVFYVRSMRATADYPMLEPSTALDRAGRAVARRAGRADDPDADLRLDLDD